MALSLFTKRGMKPSRYRHSISSLYRKRDNLRVGAADSGIYERLAHIDLTRILTG
jgi:hypothetical protein